MLVWFPSKMAVKKQSSYNLKWTLGTTWTFRVDQASAVRVLLEDHETARRRGQISQRGPKKVVPRGLLIFLWPGPTKCFFLWFKPVFFSFWWSKTSQEIISKNRNHGFAKMFWSLSIPNWPGWFRFQLQLRPPSADQIHLGGQLGGATANGKKRFEPLFEVVNTGCELTKNGKKGFLKLFWTTFLGKTKKMGGNSGSFPHVRLSKGGQSHASWSRGQSYALEFGQSRYSTVASDRSKWLVK